MRPARRQPRRFPVSARASPTDGLGCRLLWDTRDTKPATSELSHPLIYHFPGRVLIEHEGLYHSLSRSRLSRTRWTGRVQRFDVAQGDDVKFARIAAEVQQFQTLFWRDRVLAARVRLDKVFPLDDGIAPYDDLPTLGGGNRLRGLQARHLPRRGALLAALEYRWPIWDTWSQSLFWEEGQVFDDFGDIEADRFGSTIGDGWSCGPSRPSCLACASPTRPKKMLCSASP